MDHAPYIRQVPGSRQAVLMIHGIVGTPRHFDCLIPHIPHQWSVYNILLDGHGGQPREFSRTSMKKWKAQTDRQLAALCAEYDHIVVIAHSMGTLLTLEAAPRFPQVKALILLNVPLCPRVHPALIPRLLKLCLGKLDPEKLPEASLQRAAGVLPTWKLWQYIGFIPRYLELLALCRQSRKGIAGLSLPCHVFFSAADELVSLRSSRFFLRHPTARLHTLAHSGHFYYTQEDLPAITKAMREFLSS